eukprot:tig00000553_g2089.t1
MRTRPALFRDLFWRTDLFVPPGPPALRSALCERYNSGESSIEELCDLVNKAFCREIEVVQKHGGEIVSFLGDGLLVYWPLEDDIDGAAEEGAADGGDGAAKGGGADERGGGLPEAAAAGMSRRAAAAVSCAIEVQELFSALRLGEGMGLRLRVAIAAGPYREYFCGIGERGAGEEGPAECGSDFAGALVDEQGQLVPGRMVYFITSGAIREAGEALGAIHPGQVAVCDSVFAYLPRGALGLPEAPVGCSSSCDGLSSAHVHAAAPGGGGHALLAPPSFVAPGESVGSASSGPRDRDRDPAAAAPSSGALGGPSILNAIFGGGGGPLGRLGAQLLHASSPPPPGPHARPRGLRALPSLPAVGSNGSLFSLERASSASDRGAALVLEGPSRAAFEAFLAAQPPPAPLAGESPEEIVEGMGEEQRAALLLYVPYAVRARVDQLERHGAAIDIARYMSEFRAASVMFVSLAALDTAFGVVQRTVQTLQALLYAHQGSLRQVVLDDKGLVLIGVFGLWPVSHEDDPVRCSACALDMAEAMHLQGLKASIGISTGLVYSTFVGSPTRCEYSVFGTVVNKAARLMAMADGGILADEATAAAAGQRVLMNPAGEAALKGIAEPVRLFAPRGLRKATWWSSESPGESDADEAAGGGGGGGAGVWPTPAHGHPGPSRIPSVPSSPNGRNDPSRSPPRKRGVPLISALAEAARQLVSGGRGWEEGGPASPRTARTARTARSVGSRISAAAAAGGGPRSSLIILEGESGMGKSALLRSVWGLARARGAAVAASALRRHHRRQPFNGWRHILQSLFPLGELQMGPFLDREGVELLPELAAALALDPDASVDGGLGLSPPRPSALPAPPRFGLEPDPDTALLSFSAAAPSTPRPRPEGGPPATGAGALALSPPSAAASRQRSESPRRGRRSLTWTEATPERSTPERSQGRAASSRHLGVRSQGPGTGSHANSASRSGSRHPRPPPPRGARWPPAPTPPPAASSRPRRPPRAEAGAGLAERTDEARAAGLRALIVRLVLRRAALGPLVLLFDDVHWGDSQTWLTLQDLVGELEEAEGSRVALVVAARPRRPAPPAPPRPAPPRPAPRAATEPAAPAAVALQAMRLADAEELAASVLRARSLPRQLASFVYEQSSGIPSVVIDVAQALQENGFLHVAPGGEVQLLKALRPVKPTDAVRSALCSRLDRLEGPQLLVLKLAAVLLAEPRPAAPPPPLPARASPEASGAALHEMEHALRALCELQILRAVARGERPAAPPAALATPRASPKSEWEFVHATMHETTYTRPRGRPQRGRQRLGRRQPRQRPRGGAAGEREQARRRFAHSDLALVAHHFLNAGEPTRLGPTSSRRPPPPRPRPTSRPGLTGSVHGQCARAALEGYANVEASRLYEDLLRVRPQAPPSSAPPGSAPAPTPSAAPGPPGRPARLFAEAVQCAREGLALLGHPLPSGDGALAVRYALLELRLRFARAPDAASLAPPAPPEAGCACACGCGCRPRRTALDLLCCRRPCACSAATAGEGGGDGRCACAGEAAREACRLYWRRGAGVGAAGVGRGAAAGERGGLVGRARPPPAAALAVEDLATARGMLQSAAQLFPRTSSLRDSLRASLTLAFLLTRAPRVSADELRACAEALRRALDKSARYPDLIEETERVAAQAAWARAMLALDRAPNALDALESFDQQSPARRAAPADRAAFLAAHATALLAVAGPRPAPPARPAGPGFAGLRAGGGQGRAWDERPVAGLAVELLPGERAQRRAGSRCWTPSRPGPPRPPPRPRSGAGLAWARLPAPGLRLRLRRPSSGDGAAAALADPAFLLAALERAAGRLARLHAYPSRLPARPLALAQPGRGPAGGAGGAGGPRGGGAGKPRDEGLALLFSALHAPRRPAAAAARYAAGRWARARPARRPRVDPAAPAPLRREAAEVGPRGPAGGAGAGEPGTEAGRLLARAERCFHACSDLYLARLARRLADDLEGRAPSPGPPEAETEKAGGGGGPKEEAPRAAPEQPDGRSPAPAAAVRFCVTRAESLVQEA